MSVGDHAQAASRTTALRAIPRSVYALGFISLFMLSPKPARK